MSNFIDLVKERRSANNFIPDVQISELELRELFELVKLGPSAFNLQHTYYKVVLDPAMKEKLRKAANGQYKVHSASAVIIVLGDKEAYKQAPHIYEGLQMLGVINKQEYDQMVEDTTQFYEIRGEAFKQEDAVRNASLSAMLFMLAAKEKGWDTCPMIGFDADAVRELLEVEDSRQIVMMITIGKEKLSSRGPRGYRKPVNEFVEFY